MTKECPAGENSKLKVLDALKLSSKQGKIEAKLCMEFSLISPWFLQDLSKFLFFWKFVWMWIGWNSPKPRGATTLKKNLGIAKTSQQLDISTENLENNSD